MLMHALISVAPLVPNAHASIHNTWPFSWDNLHASSRRPHYALPLEPRSPAAFLQLATIPQDPAHRGLWTFSRSRAPGAHLLACKVIQSDATQQGPFVQCATRGWGGWHTKQLPEAIKSPVDFSCKLSSPHLHDP